MSEATIPIKELMEKTEQWLLGQGYKKSTLGFYRATWNRFLSYSASPAYSRETAEQFLLQYFGVDVHAIDQTLDGRMRHARRHMNALDEIFRTGTVCRRKVYVFLWIFTALVADYEPVQMVFKITNTFTTLAAIGGNILIPVVSIESLPDTVFWPGYDNATILTIAFNLFILPLVAAGYLAQLVKDLHQYLKTRDDSAH